MYISIYIYIQKTPATFCCGLCVCRQCFSPAEDTSGCLNYDGPGALWASGVRGRDFGKHGELCRAWWLSRNNRDEVDTERKEMVLHDVL